MERPRLIKHLHAGFAGPLRLLSAPAGFGKTTLLVDALQRYLAHIAWVSLDPDESDPVRFVRYMLPALQPFAPTLWEVGEAMLQPLHHPRWLPF